MKKKVFISIPMNGRPDEDVRRDMDVIMDDLGPDHELIDTMIEEDAPECREPRLWYLGRSIQMMCNADLVVFANDWGSANGCIVEYHAAKKYGLQMLYWRRQ